MAELTTKTLNELATVESVASTDHVLIESGGRMKRADSSLVGGAAYVLYASDFNLSPAMKMTCNNTTIYNGLLKAIDEGRSVIIMDGYNGGVYYPYVIHVYSDNVISVMISLGENVVFPSDGYSSSALYTPQNITPTDTYNNGDSPR